MNDKELAAVKLALVALEEWYFGCGAGSESHDDAVEAIKQAIAQDALDKMAENARELGLDYEPAVHEGRDWSLLAATQESLREHMAEIKRLKAAQPAPVQEPVAWVNHGENRITRATGWDGYGALYTTPPAAQRQWVGLTDEEIDLFINGRGDADDDNYVEPTGDGFGLTDADLLTLVRRAESKLKELNHV